MLFYFLLNYEIINKLKKLLLSNIILIINYKCQINIGLFSIKNKQHNPTHLKTLPYILIMYLQSTLPNEILHSTRTWSARRVRPVMENRWLDSGVGRDAYFENGRVENPSEVKGSQHLSLNISWRRTLLPELSMYRMNIVHRAIDWALVFRMPF